MRKISWRLASCYNPSRVHSRIALAHYMQFNILYVISVFVIAEMSVALTDSSPGIRPIASSPPHRGGYAHCYPRGRNLVVCDLY